MIETDDKGNVIGYKNISMFPDDVESITMTRQDYDRHIENLLYENVELKQRINKAIEYIENNWIEYSDFQYVDNDDELTIDCESIKKLLDILKGSDSNE